MSYPKYRVTNYQTGFAVQRKSFWWLPWLTEEDYYGVERYRTYKEAEEVVKARVKFLVEDQIKREKAKKRITNEEFSVADYIKNYPEEFL